MPVRQSGLRIDQYVPVGSLRPGDATLGEPGQQGLVRKFAEPLGVSGDGDATVGQVEVVQGEASDGRSAGGVDGGQGDDQPLHRSDGDPLDGEDLGVGHRQQIALDLLGLEPGGGVAKIRPRFLAKRDSERSAAMALRRCHPRRGDSAAVIPTLTPARRRRPRPAPARPGRAAGGRAPPAGVEAVKR